MIDRLKVIVLENNQARRSQLCNWISKEGYSTYQCRDPYKLMRMVHQVNPDFVIMNYNLKGVSMLQAAKYIEEKTDAQVVFLKDGNTIGDFSYFLVIPIPITKFVFLQTLEYAKHNLIKRRELTDQIKKLQKHIGRDPVIDKAKRYLMERWNLPDGEAYKILRQRSMNEGKAIEIIAGEIIEGKDI